jgi:hypothetical protein
MINVLGLSKFINDGKIVLLILKFFILKEDYLNLFSKLQNKQGKLGKVEFKFTLKFFHYP